MSCAYTDEELDTLALQDLETDARCAEEDAAKCDGDRREELLNYAVSCREAIERYRNGGAHQAVLNGLACAA